MRYGYAYETKIGEIGIVEENGAVVFVFFDASDIPQDVILKETDTVKETAKQIYEYLDGKRKEFTVKIKPEGGVFFKKVWSAMVKNLPYGKTITYGGLARLAGNPKAARAVGSANNHNPIPIIIPCHRVLGANGKLTGFAGGLDVKIKLLQTEGITLFKK